MNINGFGSLNKLFQSGSVNKSVPQAGGHSVAGGGLTQDTVQFSVASQLGTSAHPVVNIGGVPVKLDPASLNPNTLIILQQAAKNSSFEFPPVS